MEELLDSLWFKILDLIGLFELLKPNDMKH